MSIVVSPQPPHQHLMTFPGVLSIGECVDLVEDAAKHELEEAKIRVGHDYSKQVIDRSYRWAHLLKIPQLTEYSWLYQRLIACADQANEVFNFNIEREFSEPIVLLRYGIGGHYKEHTDVNKGVIGGRRISIVVQLSPPEDYEGGSLIFRKAGQVASTEQGSATLFPSSWIHQVQPVTRGTRFALVAWINSPIFDGV
ncbi:MAG: 2OG-Fe(II) oxygenase [Moorea sp. SIO1G6]|uniref:2OG-Fe(II) oxygenase n=1 Tax=Moorena producens (strain JHB) TaxID=1454205 RepID=A0A1D9G511_MOOP1|nr:MULTISPECIES: 2OG-Fe(II) oxygenase [Moorena]AOY82641.1 2OG-Fe(II) oxygenase [Moorena producens JHB]NET67444.1 2OG-Fe(II) oxygenase [Moorena sp. SIO1G6]